jgi:hypothetical protein
MIRDQPPVPVGSGGLLSLNANVPRCVAAQRIRF